MSAPGLETAPLCERCGKFFACRNSSLCSPCGKQEPYQHKGQRTNDKGEEGSNVYELPPLQAPVLCAGNSAEKESDEPKEMIRLLVAHEQGLLEPADVRLEAPAWAGKVQRAMAAHLRLCFGLRIAVGHDPAFPLPYSVSFAIDVGKVTNDEGTAGHARAALVRYGTIDFAGVLKPWGKPNGLKLYRLPAAEVERLRGAS